MSFAADLRDKAATLWHLQRVKRLVRDRARTCPPAVVTVTEFACDDPTCPGPTTQITILGFDLMRRVLLIHRPAAEITVADLEMIGT